MFDKWVIGGLLDQVIVELEVIGKGNLLIIGSTMNVIVGSRQTN